MYAQSRKIGKSNNFKSQWERENRMVQTGYPSSVRLYVLEGIIHLLVSVSVLTWFLGYILLKFKFQKLK
jgi:hypothetical protein